MKLLWLNYAAAPVLAAMSILIDDHGLRMNLLGTAMGWFTINTVGLGIALFTKHNPFRATLRFQARKNGSSETDPIAGDVLTTYIEEHQSPHLVPFTIWYEPPRIEFVGAYIHRQLTRAGRDKMAGLYVRVGDWSEDQLTLDQVDGKQDRDLTVYCFKQTAHIHIDKVSRQARVYRGLLRVSPVSESNEPLELKPSGRRCLREVYNASVKADPESPLHIRLAWPQDLILKLAVRFTFDHNFKITITDQPIGIDDEKDDLVP